MKPAAGNLVIVLVGGFVALFASAAWIAPAARAGTTPASPAPTVPPTRDLLAHGTDQWFWSADVIPFLQGRNAATKTVLRARGAGDAQWRVIGEFEAAASQLSNRDGELLVVLSGGDWKMISSAGGSGGARSGTPLPGGALVLAMAGDGDDVWAVAAAPEGQMLPAAPTTSPTTRAAANRPRSATTRSAATAATTTAATTTTTSTASAAPTTTPTSLPPHDVALFRLSRGEWSEVGPLPRGVARRDLKLRSLAVLDRKLTLAVSDGGAVRVFTRDVNGGAGGWDAGSELTVAAADARIKLLDLHGRPALWIADRAGPGTLFVSDDPAAGSASPVRRWSDPIRLQPSPKLSAFDRSALATALGQLRLLASDAKGRLAEQNYDEKGNLVGAATEAQTAPNPVDTRVAQVIQLVVIALLLVWMTGAMKQRPKLQEAVARVDELNLASVSRRAVGGLIDALPIFLSLYLASASGPTAAATGIDGLAPVPIGGGPRMTYHSPEVAWFAAGLGVYFLHTTIMELLTTRSLGKIITRTRVANLDGARPKPAQLMLRNLLRMVDLLMPVFVFLSPLRQRIGDMAAGTIVVTATAAEPPATADAPTEPPAPAT